MAMGRNMSDGFVQVNKSGKGMYIYTYRYIGGVTLGELKLKTNDKKYLHMMCNVFDVFFLEAAQREQPNLQK